MVAHTQLIYILNVMKLIKYPIEQILCYKICGRRFETTESLQEVLMAEKEDLELRNKDFADG